MLMLVLLLVAQADVRARAYALEEARPTAMAAGILPGRPATDEQVRADAAHFCGSSDACRAVFERARDRLFEAFHDEGEVKEVRRELSRHVDGGFTNWMTAAQAYFPRESFVPVDPILPGTRAPATSGSGSTAVSRLDCYSWTDSSGYHSECRSTTR